MIECDVSLSSTNNIPVMGTDGNNGLSFEVGNINYNSENNRPTIIVGKIVGSQHPSPLRILALKIGRLNFYDQYKT